MSCLVDIVDSSGSGIEHINSIIRTDLRYDICYCILFCHTCRHGSNNIRQTQTSKLDKKMYNRTGQVLTRFHISSLSRLPTLIARTNKRAHTRMNRLRGRVPKFVTKKEMLPTINANTTDTCEVDDETQRSYITVAPTLAVVTESCPQSGTSLNGCKRAKQCRQKVAGAAVRKANLAMRK